MTDDPKPQASNPGKAAAPKFHKPDTSIQGKVGKTTMPLDLVLSKTDDIMAQASREFGERVSEQTQKLADAALLLAQSPSMENIAALKFLSHDLRGEAGSFGYELLGKICEKLNEFLTGLTEVNDIVVVIVDLHVKALQAIASQKLSGHGSAEGEKNLKSLISTTEQLLKHSLKAVK